MIDKNLETLFHEWLKLAREETVRWSESITPAFLVETDDAIFGELRGIVGPVRFGLCTRAGNEAYNASAAYVYGPSNTGGPDAALVARETWETAYFATLVTTVLPGYRSGPSRAHFFLPRRDRRDSD